MAESQAPRKPIYDFDYFADPSIRADAHEGYWRLKQDAPPVFWTEKNGGHWVVTDADAAIKVLRHPEIFSSRILSIPPNPEQQNMIPIMLDPPEHRAYRQMLRPYFEKKAIEALEPRIEEWAERLIADIADSGDCEFVEAVGSRFPVLVFMELFGFPLEQFELFRGTVVDFFDAAQSDDRRRELAMQIVGIIAQLFEERRADPKDDLISTLVSIDFEGRKLRSDELISIGFLMFLAGLDTVVSALTFGMRHLAHDKDLRTRMREDPECIPDAVEELMRRYAFVSLPRYVAEDTELEGAQIKAGDSVLVPLSMIGWDEKYTSCPHQVSLDRPHCRHAAFGSGIHTCLGIHLARMEMAIFYKVWLEKIGDFREVERSAPQFRLGSVQALEQLHLAWENG
jgi:cytochrome P450